MSSNEPPPPEDDDAVLLSFTPEQLRFIERQIAAQGEERLAQVRREREAAEESVAQERRKREAAEESVAQERRKREAAEESAAQERREREAAEESAAQQRREREAAEERAAQERREREAAEESARQADLRTKQAAEDAAAVRKALADEREEQQRLQTGQGLADYVALEHQRNFHLPRLLPKVTAAKRKTTASKASKATTSATTGRTSIYGKYYPLRLRRWEACDAVLTAAFARIQAALGSQPLFPSRMRMDVLDSRFLEDLPQEFVDEPLYHTELKTSFFLHEVLELPASRILNAFLATQKIFFDNMNAGAHLRFVSLQRTRETDPGAEPSDTESQGSSESPSDTESQGSSESPSDPGNAARAPSRPKVPVKVQPDSIVLCAAMVGEPAEPPGAGLDDGEGGEEEEEEEGEEEEDGEEEEEGEDDEKGPLIRRIAFGEHKPAHRLRANVLGQVLQKGIGETCLVQMARKKGTGRPTDDAKTATGFPPGQVYYIYALAQTFHYMVSAGLVYGYLASGGTLTFLHIPPDDPTTLLYGPYVYPEHANGPAQAEAQAQPQAQPGGEHASLAHLPLALLCGLALQAWEAGAREERWRTSALEQLAPFPELPPSLEEEEEEGEERGAAGTASTSDPSTSTPSIGGGGSSKRPFDGDDDDDDGGGGGRRHLSVSHAHRPRVPSPLRHDTSSEHHRSKASGPHVSRFRLRRPVYLQPSRFDPVSFQPIRPYCTQACLLGLVRGLPLDEQCPNAFLHRRAACDGAMTADDVPGTRSGQTTQHAIGSRQELAQLVVLQLYGNIVQDCQCFFDQGIAGKIGCLFKLTLTGYGYTFVAKGVQTFDRRRLRREAAVYARLAAQQGRLVPVSLGVVKLMLPYPRNDGGLVSHLLLLSYGGPGLHAGALARRTRRGGDLAGVDLQREADRTWAELQALGLEDDDLDNMPSNFTWCDEARRMMRIDFHCASVAADAPLGRGPASIEEATATSAASVPSVPSVVPLSGVLLHPGTRRRRRPVDWDEGEDARPAKRVLRRRGSESTLASVARP